MDPRQVSATTIGRYRIFDEIAAGGMATVHLGRLAGAAGFARTVAVKRLHSIYAKDPVFVAMFVDEARIASRVRHPNVVPTLDVVANDDELFLVMEYVEGESLSRLLSAFFSAGGKGIDVDIAAGIMIAALHGLHAAHEATDEGGQPLGIVHRDVSPHNILVGTDGVARVVDFGIAKAAGRIQNTTEGQVKGKVAYMSPEQVSGHALDRRSDVFAAGVVLWELVTGERLFAADNAAVSILKILDGHVEPPSQRAPGVPAALDAVVLRALAADPGARFETALALAEAIERAVVPATQTRIGAWVASAAGQAIEQRGAIVARIEREAAAPVAEASTSAAAVIPVTPAARPHRQPFLAIVAVLAVGGAAALVGIRARRGSAPGASQPDVAGPAAAPSPIEATDTTAARLPSATGDPSAREAQPDASAEATSHAPVSVAPRAASTHAALPKSSEHSEQAAPPAPSASAPCRWVFTVTDQGIKIPVRQCR